MRPKGYGTVSTGRIKPDHPLGGMHS
jgi:hypothetical protein